jgi:spermidine/putrescine transport system substrate-binding protein
MDDGEMSDHNVLWRGAPGRLSRRRFGRLLAGSGLALATISFGGGPLRAAERPPVLYTWEGFDTPDFFPDYMKKHTTAPLLQTFVDENEAFENLSSGLVVDVAHPCADTFGHWRAAGLLRPIDTARLSHWSDVFAPLKTIPGSSENGEQWFIPVDWGTTSVAYRADLVQVTDDSYGLLWDKRYAGKLSIGEDATETVMMAALVAGIPDPFNPSDADLERVKQVLEEQKPLLKFYWSDDTIIKEAIASGEVVATPMWSDTFRSLKQQGVPVNYMIPKEGILSWCCGFVLTSAATQIDEAYDLIDAVLSPSAGEWLIRRGSNHSNRLTYSHLDPKVLAEMGVPQDPTDLLAHSRFLHEYPRLAAYQRIFDEIRNGT